jgi:hypothetical protein
MPSSLRVPTTKSTPLQQIPKNNSHEEKKNSIVYSFVYIFLYLYILKYIYTKRVYVYFYLFFIYIYILIGHKGIKNFKLKSSFN